MADSETSSVVKLYVELSIGALAFGALLYFMNLHVANAGITVPVWIFIMLLAVMGSMLGVDLLKQYRGG